MSNTLHASAVIGKNVQLGSDNWIGPNVVIEDGVVLGSHNKIWPGAYVCEGTTIGDHNEIHMSAVIGHIPQDVAYKGEKSFTKIGNHNLIREFVSIHRGTKAGSETVIGDHNFLLCYAHVAHNCRIANYVTLVGRSSLLGYCEVEDGAFISGMVGFHQFTRVGKLAMLSALTAVNKDIPPYMTCGGRPAMVQGMNIVGMRRAGLKPDVRADIKKAFKLLYYSDLNISQATAEIEKQCVSAEVAHLVQFVKASKRGICVPPRGKTKESLFSDEIL
jgi:UDP-N-acetylglucosamine acyltransferase